MVSDDGEHEGNLFRRNYLRSDTKLPDSKRARRRIFHVFIGLSVNNGHDAFAEVVETLLGIDYPSGYDGYLHREFWDDVEIGDFLSAITLWYRVASDPQRVLNISRQIFGEEDLQYRIDDKGGVHYLVDEEFSRLSETTLLSLATAPFTSARHALDTALKSLGPAHQSGKGLIRGVFEAAESAFLVVAGPQAGNRLNGPAVEKFLKPRLIAQYAGAPEANDKVTRMLSVFEAWVKDAHPYRHGAAFDQIHEAPLDLAILSATTGMGFIRFLAGIGPKLPNDRSQNWSLTTGPGHQHR